MKRQKSGKHPDAGDIFVYLKPGYVFQPEIEGEAPIFGSPTFKGDHGYSLGYDESFGAFISKEPCEACSVTDIAEIITKKLDSK